MKKFQEIFVLVFVILMVCSLVACGSSENGTETSAPIAESPIKFEEFYHVSDGVTAHYSITSYEDDTFLFITESAKMYLEYLSNLDESQIVSINISTYHVSSWGTTNTYFITYKSPNTSVGE